MTVSKKQTKKEKAKADFKKWFEAWEKHIKGEGDDSS